MKTLVPTAALFLSCAAFSPALAQSTGVGGNPGGLHNPAALQPRPPAPDILPPAIPGVMTPQPAIGPVVRKPITGDPTTALFGAVNNGDYNAAQDAVSRGADLQAQNNLGETALDLSIALNRNDITFMLLSARNEGGEPPPGSAMAVAAVPLGHGPAPAVHRSRTLRARMTTPLRYHPVAGMPAGDAVGTPDPSAGFLGFGPAK